MTLWGGLAFEVQAQGVTCIIFAKSHAQARYAAYLAMADAGYGVGRLVDTRIRALRLRRLDGAKTKNGGCPIFGRALAPELFSHILKEPT